MEREVFESSLAVSLFKGEMSLKEGRRGTTNILFHLKMLLYLVFGLRLYAMRLFQHICCMLAEKFFSSTSLMLRKHLRLPDNQSATCHYLQECIKFIFLYLLLP